MSIKHHKLYGLGERISCSSDLEIRVKNGRAIVSGTACSTNDIRQAEAVLYALPGVSKVYNLIKAPTS